MAQYEDPNVLVALDESAVDDQTIQRRFGSPWLDHLVCEGQPF